MRELRLRKTEPYKALQSESSVFAPTSHAAASLCRGVCVGMYTTPHFNNGSVTKHINLLSDSDPYVYHVPVTDSRKQA